MGLCFAAAPWANRASCHGVVRHLATRHLIQPRTCCGLKVSVSGGRGNRRTRDWEVGSGLQSLVNRRHAYQTGGYIQQRVAELVV
jgi:hypothetical protein